jgi:hypothetical protein
LQTPLVHESPLAQSLSVAHDVLHAVPSQAYGAQSEVAPVSQVPVPLHFLAAVSVAPLHDSTPQVGSLLAVPHAERPPTGAPVTGEHVPLVPVRLHASHCPAHAVLQQTPSTQLPLAQSFADAHVAPLAMVPWQMPPSTQVALLSEHWLVVAQLVRHADAPQTYGAHASVVAAGQCPAPSQLAASVSVPALQLAAVHCDVGYVHAVTSVPLHAPPQVEPVPVHAVRPPTGAPVTAVHVPRFPVTLQASHCPEQPVLQQKPSTQLPVEH